MSKPGKSLRNLCKKLRVRLTVKRGKKRVYKSVTVLKAQCNRKKKKKVKRKRRRKFGSSLMGDDNKWKAVLHKNPKYCEICNQDEKHKRWCRFDSKNKCESFLQEYDRPLKRNYTKKSFYFPIGAHTVSKGYNFPGIVENRIASFLGPEPQEVGRQRRRLIDELNLINYSKIATDDGTTPTNITGFTEVPPADLKLYVHYRGKVNDGNKHKFNLYHLGYYPKKIEGTLIPHGYRRHLTHKVWNNEDWFDNDDKRRFELFIQITNSEDPIDIGEIKSIRGDRDIVSLLPFTNSGDFGKKKVKKKRKKKKRKRKK